MGDPYLNARYTLEVPRRYSGTSRNSVARILRATHVRICGGAHIEEAYGWRFAGFWAKLFNRAIFPADAADPP